jgi:hypothetical protein
MSAHDIRKEIELLLEKIPESKLQTVLEFLKSRSVTEEFVYDNLTEEVDSIMKEDAELLKRLAK